MSKLLGMLGLSSPREFVGHFDPAALPETVPSGMGGTPVNLLTHELLRRGQRVALFTLDKEVKQEVVLRGPQLTICIVPWRAGRPARDFFAAERAGLLRAVQRERPDFLHAQWTYEYSLVAQSSGIPHVITAHDAPWSVLRLNFIPFRVARTLMAYRVLMRAKLVAGVAPYVARHLRRYMLYRGPALVIPNGMPASLFNREPRARSEGAPVTFATVLAGWSGRKNGEAAIEAFAKVRQTVPDARLLMFGNGHGAGEPAERWANERGWSGGIEFAGHVPHEVVLRRLGGEVDVLVHPALEEAQPMALIEAMAQRVPVIAGRRSGGVPWTLDDGRAGVLVDITRPDEIASAMLELAQDPQLRHDWGEKGRKLAEERFHIRSVADAYEPIYAELATMAR